MAAFLHSAMPENGCLLHKTASACKRRAMTVAALDMNVSCCKHICSTAGTVTKLKVMLFMTQIFVVYN